MGEASVLRCWAKDWGNVAMVQIWSLEFRDDESYTLRTRESQREAPYCQFASIMLKNQNETVSQECGELSKQNPELTWKLYL